MIWLSVTGSSYVYDCPLSRDVWGLGRFEKTRTTEDKDVRFVQDAYLIGECDVSPGEFVHQVFVLLYSLIEGCKKVTMAIAFLFPAMLIPSSLGGVECCILLPRLVSEVIRTNWSSTPSTRVGKVMWGLYRGANATGSVAGVCACALRPEMAHQYLAGFPPHMEVSPFFSGSRSTKIVVEATKNGSSSILLDLSMAIT